MDCPKHGCPMVCKQRPEAAVGAGKPKGASGRCWYCKKCGKYYECCDSEDKEGGE